MTIKLYSFRRCPYAIRARIALNIAKIKYNTVEINLKEKPNYFFNISPKGTVPVLEISEKEILDESIDIMLWAFNKKKMTSIYKFEHEKQFKIIKTTEDYFKPLVDKFKYGKNLSPNEKNNIRYKAELFLSEIELLLRKNISLFCSEKMIADYAIFPFIRQFFFSDTTYFKNEKFMNLSNWLESIIKSDLFFKVMKKNT